MDFLDALESVSLSFTTSKFKTILSSLGIIIGVTAIVVMLSVGEGLQQGVSSAFGGMDLDVITIYPGGNFRSSEGHQKLFQEPAEFTEKDVHILENTIGVKTVSPRREGSAYLEFRGEERRASITGIDPEQEPDLEKQIEKGRFLLQNERGGIVIGHDIATNMFKQTLNPGMRITLKNKDKGINKTYKITGILKKKQETTAFGNTGTDLSIYLTHKALEEFQTPQSYTYSYILVKVEDPEKIEETSRRIDENLRRHHRDQAYTVFIMKTILESINQVMNMIKYGLGGIGAISLLVGGIGIVNVMMLTVTERIKEIGIMKAVGASQSDIQTLFMLESALLGLVSSLIGITLGIAITIALSSLGSFPATLTWPSIATGLTFGITTTMAAGVYPANKAAKLDPVEALRTE